MTVKLDKTTDHFLSLPEVQSVLRIKSRKTILKYIKSGKLPAYKLGGTRWRITPTDIESFLKNQQVGTIDRTAREDFTKAEKGSVTHGIG